MRVDAFEAVRGFQPRLIAGEESEFCLRLRGLRWKIWRLDAEMTQHDAAMTHFGQWWRRAVRSGYGYAEGCHLCARSSEVLWKRQLMRSVFWGAAVPLAIALGAFVTPFAIAAPVVYPLQIGRIALRHDATMGRSWAYGAFMTLGHFPALQGIIKFYWHRWCGRSSELIEYKGVG